MCRCNFNGQLELQFLPYQGGFYEQSAPLLDRIFLIIGNLNKAISKKQERSKNS
jgi:hypothetical protein